MKFLQRGVLASTGIAALLLAAACSREPGTGDAAYSPTAQSSSVKPGFFNLETAVDRLHSLAGAA